MNEIRPGGVYTTNEVRAFLRVSESTMKRLLKNGLIRANKIGGQYRILGHEILRLVSPVLDKEATRHYQQVKKKVGQKVSTW